MFEGCDGRVCDAWPLQVRQFFAALNRQLRRGLVIVIKSAEIGRGGCFHDRREASLQEVLWEKACPDCVLVGQLRPSASVASTHRAFLTKQAAPTTKIRQQTLELEPHRCSIQQFFLGA